MDIGVLYCNFKVKRIAKCKHVADLLKTGEKNDFFIKTTRYGVRGDRKNDFQV